LVPTPTTAASVVFKLRVRITLVLNLIELCQQTLGWGDVNYDRDSQGRRLLRSLRLRTDGDIRPTLEDSLTLTTRLTTALTTYLTT
jgi:hypothetical protein